MLMKAKQMSPGPWVKKHDRGQGSVKYWAPSPVFPSGDRRDKCKEWLGKARVGSEAHQRTLAAISPALGQNTPSAALLVF